MTVTAAIFIHTIQVQRIRKKRNYRTRKDRDNLSNRPQVSRGLQVDKPCDMLVEQKKNL